jgi:hypothetical protein
VFTIRSLVMPQALGNTNEHGKHHMKGYTII